MRNTPVPLHHYRASVWYGPQSGRWYVDAYAVGQRTPGTSVLSRPHLDRATGTTVLEYETDERLEALELARTVVGILSTSVTIRDAGLHGPCPGKLVRSGGVLGLVPAGRQDTEDAAGG